MNPRYLSTLAWLLALATQPTSAAIRTWDGGYATQGGWAYGANWVGNTAPAAGDDLYFPSGAARLVNSNNFPAYTTFRSIIFTGDGYDISGNPIALTSALSDITGGAGNMFRPAIRLGAPIGIRASAAGAQLSILGNIDLNGKDLELYSVGELRCGGVISGAGNITMLGNGRVVFSGIGGNMYIGDTTVLNGTLELAKYLLINPGGIRSPRIAVTGNLFIGTNSSSLISDAVVFQASDQISTAAEVTLNSTAELNLNGYDQTIRYLIIAGGHARSGSGTLTVTHDVTCHLDDDGSVISGNLHLDQRTGVALHAPSSLARLVISAAIPSPITLRIMGAGEVTLSGANAYTGGTLVTNGVLRVVGNSALGTGTNGVALHGGRLVLANASFSGRALTARRTQLTNPQLDAEGLSSAWNGDIVVEEPQTTLFVDVASGSSLALNGSVSGNGSLRKQGPGLLRLSGTNFNTFTGDTSVDEGALELAKEGAVAVVGRLLVGHPLGGAGVLRYAASNQVADTAGFSLWSGGLVQLLGWTDRISWLAGSGEISLGTGTLTVGQDGFSSLYSGVLSGSGSLVKTGANTLKLTGASTYTGSTLISGGALLVNGGLNASGIVQVGNGAILGGTGVVGNVVASFGSSVWPGASPGELTATSLILSNGGMLNIELNGTTPGASYDRLKAAGNVTLGGFLRVNTGFLPAIGDSFLILNKTSAGAVSGTFSGLAEGQTVAASNTLFRITYTGGDGNDVVLTKIANVFRPALTIERLPPASVRLLWPTNDPAFTLQLSTNLNATNWAPAPLPPVIIGTNNVVTNSGGEGQKFYRLRRP